MTFPEKTLPRCLVCSAPAKLIEASYPGYRAGTSFAIAECSSCVLSFAAPTISDSVLYEAIYKQRAIIPGYERYDRYARRTSRVRDPLAFLAAKEECYWSVSQIAKTLPPDSKVLDVGSGLGYLTFALSCAGLSATGLDISQEAVADARRRFGDRYVAADFFVWSQQYPDEYDLVVMLELIEHVENPGIWLRAAMRLVKPGGRLLLSTPNRDFYPADTVWETEAPPVHLWWFSPKSIQRLAREEGFDAEIMDLRQCVVPVPPLPAGGLRTRRSPMLDRDGKSVSRLRPLLQRLGLLDLTMAVYEGLNRRRARRASASIENRETLVAVVPKPLLTTSSG